MRNCIEGQFSFRPPTKTISRFYQYAGSSIEYGGSHASGIFVVTVADPSIHLYEIRVEAVRLLTIKPIRQGKT